MNLNAHSAKNVTHGMIILLGFGLVSMDAKAKTKPKFDGYMSSGFEAESFQNGESLHQGKLTIETKRKNGIKAEFGVRARTKNNDVDIREAVINKKYDDDWKLEFGYGKKRFGLESDRSRLKRSTIDRSLIYRRLEVFTYTGRESGLRYYKKMNPSTMDSGYSYSLSHSESQNSSLVGSWRKPLSPAWSFNYWLQVQSDHVDNGQQLVGAAMHSFERRDDDSLFQWELLGGVDPEETELRKLLGKSGKVGFVGNKFHYEQSYSLENDEWWQWIVQANAMVHDLDLPDFNSFGLLVGFNYGFDPVRLGLNLEGVGSTNRIDPKDRNFSESSAKIEMIYEF